MTNKNKPRENEETNFNAPWKVPIVENFNLPVDEVKAPVAQPKEVIKTSVESMPCPVKDHNGKVEIIRTNGRDYAICYCPGKNKYYGHIVWERR